ncbi:3-dehydroquinate synthase [Candidatus Pelagibacter sp.]|nr:3-dehydroquinate synthase [Candidatus Pelagibacter sp.]
MNQIKLNVKTKTQKYPIFIGKNLCSKVAKLSSESKINFKKCLLVVDTNVPKNFISIIKRSLKKKKVYIYYFNATEINKNIISINKIIESLLNKNFSREDCLISIGGGITGDVAGFAASLFKRGLKFINLPTTLLSQVDSSIGGKTGVNTKYGKNLIGSFYQPNLVISDTNFLKTLPKREIICGYGEILKHSLIGNKKFYIYLYKNTKNILKLSSPFLQKAIYESCKIKKNIVEKDEKEKNLRKALNFGHTFAHAYEATLGYKQKLNHGEAVILGMITALDFSLKQGLIKNKEFKSIMSHIKNSNLPTSVDKFFGLRDVGNILSFMTKDKKNTSNKINLVLLKKIGTPEINKHYSKKYINLFLKKFLRN